jgi:DNA-binding LacI/PurR family transcriptional regulator
MSKGAGIRDVARLAGVAPSTVSRVLNRKLDGVHMSPITIERIHQAAATLHYQPNPAARSLRTTHAGTIGVIARTLLHPFNAELLRVISTGCRARGYHLLLGHAEHSTSEGWTLGDILSADRVDGVLVLGDILSETSQKEDMEQLISTHTHVVTVGARPSVAGEIAILVDDTLGVTLALDHLLAQGHRAIGYISQRIGPESWEDQQRRAAYRDFLRRHDLPSLWAYEQVVSNDLASIEAALQSLAALAGCPTAVLVANDVTALVTIKAALARGIRVPDDLSVVGFDDIPFAALCTPGLTTIRQPIETMGQYAANILLDNIAGAGPSGESTPWLSDTTTLIFPPTLVCRESVHPIG